MIWIVPTLIIVLILYGPRAWALSTLAAYRDEEYFSGDGFDFARLLLKDLGLDDVKVEVSLSGDHYDPLQNIVRLSRENCGKRSLTSIVVAAHEIGHAIQRNEGYVPLLFRTRLAAKSHYVEKAGAALMIGVPLVAFFFRIPLAGIISVAAGLAALGFPAVVHLLTLPVEFDASFGKALPLLSSGKWIPPGDVPKARKILFACALTYVSSALAGLLNFWRWARFMR